MTPALKLNIINYVGYIVPGTLGFYSTNNFRNIHIKQHIKYFSTTKKLNAGDPLSFAALSFYVTNPGVLPLAMAILFPVVLGMGYQIVTVIDLIQDSVNTGWLADWAANWRTGDMILDGYIREVNALIVALRETLASGVSFEEMSAIRVNLLQIITIHEGLYDLVTDLVNNTESPMDYGWYNSFYEDLRESGNNLVELYREVETHLRINHYITVIMPQFWFEN